MKPSALSHLNMTWRRRFTIVSISLLCVICIGALVMIVYASKLKNDSASLLTVAKDFDLEALRVSDLNRLASLYPQYVYYLDHNDNRTDDAALCSKDSCRMGFDVDNAWLAWIGWTPKTDFVVVFDLEEGSVTSRFIHLSARQHTLEHTVSIWDMPVWPETDPRRMPTICKRSGDELYHAYYNLNSATTASEREEIYSLNLKCLTALGGCQDVSEMLPGACSPQESSSR